jgi:hypothetical protein
MIINSQMRINPNSLITNSRLDICSKIPLARAWAFNHDEKWGRELYLNYLLRIEPSGGFSQDESKYSLEDYYKKYRELFESIKNNGFDESRPLPHGKHGIVNGSHRVAITSVLNQNISITHTNDLDQKYDFNFLNRIGLNDIYKDAMVSEFLQIHKNIRVYCLFGLPEKIIREIYDFVARKRKLIYYKHVQLSQTGQRRLMKILYGRNTWWKNELMETLSYERFTKSFDSAVFIFMESKTIDEEILFKKTVREKFLNGLLHKKVHSSDTTEETADISEVVLNNNSVHYLNVAPLDAENSVLDKIDKELRNSEIDLKDIVIDGSLILEMYGLRKAIDLDFTVTENLWMHGGSKKSHNHEYDLQFMKPIDLSQDPRCHFFHNNLKFMSLPALVTFKIFRGEEKDFDDIKLIVDSINSLPLQLDTHSRRRALNFRRMLILRKKVEFVLNFFPNPIPKAIKSLYRSIRKIFRELRLT